jgi:hypothetical protein
MEGVELALKKRGYPTIVEMKSKSKGADGRQLSRAGQERSLNARFGG